MSGEELVIAIPAVVICRDITRHVTERRINSSMTSQMPSAVYPKQRLRFQASVCNLFAVSWAAACAHRFAARKPIDYSKRFTT